MNIFSTKRLYKSHWSVKSSRDFTAEELDAVTDAEVVPSKYGNSICFTMKSDGITFIPLDPNSTVSVGDHVDLTQAKIVTLSKSGEADIDRILI